jgi:hypothetical protein
MDASLSRNELHTMLEGLTKLQEQNRLVFEEKRAEAVRITGELAAIAEEGKSVAASIKAVKKRLGLPVEEPRKSTSGPTKEGEIDVTFEVMLIIAEHQDKGGINIDGIDAELKAKGITVSSRDYLNTILTRKKNKQKKLIRVDGKWFLTDKGKAEVKMRTE